MQKTILFLFLFLFSLDIFAQDTVYLDTRDEKVKSTDDFAYYEVITQNENSGIIVRKYTPDHKCIQLSHFKDYLSRPKNGIQISWNARGITVDSVNYSENQMTGKRIKRWGNGNDRRIEFYDSGKLISGECFDSSGVKLDFFAEFIQAEFPNGADSLYRFIGKNFNYPKDAIAANIQGKVYISFVINKDGSVNQIKVLRGLCESIDKEAIRIVEMMPNWIPGKYEGESVNIRYTLPINCKLDSGGKKKKRRKEKINFSFSAKARKNSSQSGFPTV